MKLNENNRVYVCESSQIIFLLLFFFIFLFNIKQKYFKVQNILKILHIEDAHARTYTKSLYVFIPMEMRKSGVKRRVVPSAFV